LVRHVLVTNDFPPKVGGIQHYLGELYRRLDRSTFAVVTTKFAGADAWDARHGFHTTRLSGRLLPTRRLAALVEGVARDIGAEVIVIDPLWPLGHLARRLGLPWIGVVHGAEFILPARLAPFARDVARLLTSASGVIAAGAHVAEAVRALDPFVRVVNVPPGVDLARFAPAPEHREALRRQLMMRPERAMVLFVSRLVPRKGAHIAIDALAGLGHRLELHVVGDGRQRVSLEQRARRRGVPTVFAGRVGAAALVSHYQAADVLVFPAHDRWGGLEQEGFGIVILEAQASGIPVVAGLSGGTPEALDPGSGTLLATRRPQSWRSAVLRELDRRASEPPPVWGARAFVAERFDYDRLAPAWLAALAELGRVEDA